MKKILITGFTVLAAALFIYDCSGEKSPYTGPVEKVTLAAYAGDTGALVYIAENQGYFKDNGLKVNIKDYEAGKLATDALLAGEADIATASEFVFVTHSFNKPNLRTLATIATARVIELIARMDHGIKKPEDLKGKKIGITQKSMGEFCLGRWLTFNGLTIGDAEIVDLKPSELVDAIANGHIDAALTWDPNVYNIKRMLGENAASWPGQSGQDFFFILITTEGWIKNHPSAAKRFLKAIVQAEYYIMNNHNQAKEFIKNKFNYESDYIAYSFPRHHFVVKLPQALLLAMEDQARWRIENKLTVETEVPNYLDYLYRDGLKAVNPEAVTVIH